MVISRLLNRKKILAILFFAILAICLYFYCTDSNQNYDVTVFILDTKVDLKFVQGIPTNLHEGLSHGSIVGRVIKEEAPGVNIVSIPVEGENKILEEEKYLSGLRSVLDYKQDHPNHKVLLNISLSFKESTIIHYQLIKDLHEQGVIIIAAAGNDNTSTPIYPAGYKEVIAVANATENKKAPGSNYGEYIDLAAPGMVEYIAREYLPGEFWSKALKAEGTSFAAPKLTGLLAKILDKKPELTPEKALQIVMDTTEPISDPKFFKGELGKGVINPDRVMNIIDSYHGLEKYLIAVAIICILVLGGVVIIRWPGNFLIVFMILFVIIPFIILIGDRLLWFYNIISGIGVQIVDLFYWIGLFFAILGMTGWRTSFAFLIYPGSVGLIWLSLKFSGINFGNTKVYLMLCGWFLVWIFVGSEKYLMNKVKVIHKDIESLMSYL